MVRSNFLRVLSLFFYGKGGVIGIFFWCCFLKYFFLLKSLERLREVFWDKCFFGINVFYKFFEGKIKIGVGNMRFIYK